ncbi:hypothetical protein J5X84_08605 [Streptosporangiaceae bacterium NEAU-GS5]|nr:hypothetical protein [Streptosporangiaceae bacterium NEAU-GS5]
MKTLRRLSLALSIVVATCLLVTTGAYAASGIDTVGVTYDPDLNVMTSKDHLEVGDCKLDGEVQVTRPYKGLARLTFIFSMKTSHTSNFDQWHNSWRFYGPDGTELYRFGPIDGPRMYDDSVQAGGTTLWIHLDKATWDQFTTVSWISEC